MNIVVVAPMPREARAIVGGAVVCGAAQRAREGIERILEERRPNRVVIAGVCGGLDPSLSPGSLILARRVVRPESRALLPDAALLDGVRTSLRAAGLPFVSSTMLTVGHVTETREQRTEIWNEYGAGGVDMETYQIAEAAEARDVVWLAIRAVADPASTQLPKVLRDWDGDTTESDVLRRLARSPWEAPAFLRLAVQMRAALKSLHAAVPLVVAAASAAPDPDRRHARLSGGSDSIPLKESRR